MKDFAVLIWTAALGVGGWITSIMLLGVVLKLNSYIFMWGWNLI